MESSSCGGGSVWCDEREEAVFYRDLAEAMFGLGELQEAWHIAWDARKMLPEHLHPVVDNAIAAYSVLLTAATNKGRDGTPDWYAILGVRPWWGLSEIKRHYQYLVKKVHPDKNPSAAAHGAFTLVREAWDRVSTRAQPVYIILD